MKASPFEASHFFFLKIEFSPAYLDFYILSSVRHKSGEQGVHISTQNLPKVGASFAFNSVSP